MVSCYWLLVSGYWSLVAGPFHVLIISSYYRVIDNQFFYFGRINKILFSISNFPSWFYNYRIGQGSLPFGINCLNQCIFIIYIKNIVFVRGLLFFKKLKSLFFF